MFNKTTTLTAVIFVVLACQLQAQIDVSGTWTGEYEDLHFYEYRLHYESWDYTGEWDKWDSKTWSEEIVDDPEYHGQ